MKTTTVENIVVLANEGSIELARSISVEMGVAFTPAVKKRFADGEIYHSLPRDISGKDAIIVGATHDDEAHQELIDLIDGCKGSAFSSTV